MNTILSFLGAQGPILLYTLLGVGSALENLFPPIPADTFVLIGAFASFVFSVSLWFTGAREEGLFVGLWVPSILSLGALVLW